MFWTLIDCEKRFTIENKDVDETMLEGMDEEQKLKLLTIIKDIVAIIKDVVNIAETLHGIFKDCGGTYQIRERDIKDGITIPNNGGWIGYVIVQKGVSLDFADKTTTKIKGKAKLYVEKSNGKRKRDRKNKASLGFCTKQWNNCGNREFPSDPDPLLFRHKDGHNGKKTRKEYFPYALTIDKSTDFLKFNFGKNGIFVETVYLFGNTGCTVTSSTDW